MRMRYAPVSCIVALLASVGATAMGATALNVKVGNEFIVEQGGASIRQFPGVSTFGNDVFVGYSAHPDEITQNEVAGYKVSRDGGATWVIERYAPPGQNVPSGGIMKLANGHLLTFSFAHSRTGTRSSTFLRTISMDNGNTWQSATANMSLPYDQYVWPNAAYRGAMSNTDTMIMPDGSLRMAMYGRYVGDASCRVVWAKSTDGGFNWFVESTIAFAPGVGHPDEGYDEVAVERCADNSLLAVMRVGGYYSMAQCRSTDDGFTWSAPSALPGVDKAISESVLPYMVKMSNGVLVLAYGRPGCSLLFSADGSGYKWENYNVIYPNPQTTGYMGVSEISPGRLMIVGDRGNNWMNTTNYEIWGKIVDVTRTNVSGDRIDLKGKYLRGEATVNTDMLYVDNAGLPGSGVPGAFDQSTMYSRSAFKQGGTAGFYTIALDRIYQITALGVALKIGYASSGDVSFSTDGVSWGAPVKTYSNVTHAEVERTTFASPIAARYIRVNASTSGWPGLNEIELYCNPDGFESDASGAAPAGYVVNSGTATVSTAQAFAGTKSLRVNDTSPSAISSIRKSIPAGLSRSVEFKYFPVAAAAGHTFSISGGGLTAFHFGVFSDGSLKWTNGATWQTLPDYGWVNFNQWNTVKIDVHSARAKVWLNGQFMGIAGTIDCAITNFDTVTFASASAAGTGDDFYVDNANFDSSYNTDEDTFERGVEFAIPTNHGYTRLIGPSALITSARGHASGRALFVDDYMNNANPTIRKGVEPSQTKTLEFWIYPVAAPSGILFSLVGNGGGVNVYHFAIFSNGQIKFYNGSAWVNMSTSTLVPFNSWSKITVLANMNTAAIFRNGAYIGTAGKAGNPAANAIDGVKFSGGSTAGVGDRFHVDDVYLARGCYNDLDTFELDGVGAVAAGYTGPLATVSNAGAVEGSKSLRVNDTSTGQQALALKNVGRSTTKVMEFDLKPQTVTNGALFSMVGTGATIYHFGVFSNGNLRFYNGSAWITLTGAGNMTLGSWNRIRIEANDRGARIFANGSFAGNASRWNQTARDIDAIQFASGSTAGAGDDFLVDNVYIANEN